jgi:hypothetical protein
MNCETFDCTQFALILLVFLIEYWLGRTKKVEANSTIQLILNMVKSIIMKKGGR